MSLVLAGKLTLVKVMSDDQPAPAYKSWSSKSERLSAYTQKLTFFQLSIDQRKWFFSSAALLETPIL